MLPSKSTHQPLADRQTQPRPPKRRVVERRPGERVERSIASCVADMPMPVSRTCSANDRAPGGRCDNTSPDSVNLTAFPMMFTILPQARRSASPRQEYADRPAQQLDVACRAAAGQSQHQHVLGSARAQTPGARAHLARFDLAELEMSLMTVSKASLLLRTIST